MKIASKTQGFVRGRTLIVSALMRTVSHPE
jgi:hypothetical protein